MTKENSDKEEDKLAFEAMPLEACDLTIFNGQRLTFTHGCKCPKCDFVMFGTESNGGTNTLSFRFGAESLDLGMRCPACFIRWVNEQAPDLPTMQKFVG